MILPKTTRYLPFVLLGAVFFSGRLVAQQTVVDTKFDKVDSQGAFLTTSAPLDGDLPLAMPTTVSANPGTPDQPTSITPGKEDLGSIKPPYALLQIGQSPEHEGLAADGRILWNLSELHLAQGAYEISFDVCPRQIDKQGAGFAVNFHSKAPDFGAGVHPNRWPANIWFLTQGRLLVGGGRKDGNDGAVLMSYQPMETYHVVMLIDLDKKMWSLDINGAPLVKDSPLPDFMQTGEEFSIQSLSFGSNSGNGSEADSSFALANMLMKALR